MSDTKSLERLLDVMKRLRDKEKGCPWDIAQTSESIIKYTVEEAYEVYDAVERGDDDALKEELGDLLFHVVFHSRIAEESGKFDFFDTAQSACEKMIRRHPHVFGTACGAPDWEEMKKDERTRKSQTGILDGIAKSLPATTRALKLQNRAAGVGFDWNDPFLILDKIDEEMNELKDEMEQPSHADQREDEMGDLLFVCVNLSRKLGIDPEKALKRANAKFERRFSHIEKSLKAAGKTFEETTLDEMEALWTQAKHLERAKTP